MSDRETQKWKEAGRENAVLKNRNKDRQRKSWSKTNKLLQF